MFVVPPFHCFQLTLQCKSHTHGIDSLYTQHAYSVKHLAAAASLRFTNAAAGHCRADSTACTCCWLLLLLQKLVYPLCMTPHSIEVVDDLCADAVLYQLDRQPGVWPYKQRVMQGGAACI